MVKLTRQGAIGVVTLSRPPVNAINRETLDALYGIHEQIASDSTIRVVVVRSTQRIFCAGVDIKMISGLLSGPNGNAAMLEFIRLIQGFYTKWRSLGVPTIAALAGTATGGGLEFGLACDLRVASTGARFGLPEVKIGLLPGAGGTQMLTRVAGISTATRLILTGDLVSGSEAERLGIVHSAVSQDQVEVIAFQWAQSLAEHSAASLREIKTCLSLAPSEAGFEAEVAGSARILELPDSKKLVESFLTAR